MKKHRRFFKTCHKFSAKEIDGFYLQWDYYLRYSKMTKNHFLLLMSEEEKFQFTNLATAG